MNSLDALAIEQENRRHRAELDSLERRHALEISHKVWDVKVAVRTRAVEMAMRGFTIRKESDPEELGRQLAEAQTIYEWIMQS